MNKLTAIRIKYDDGTYSDEIPVSTLAEYIFWDDSHNLVDILGNIDMSKGTVQAQLNEKIDDNDLNQYLSDEIGADVGDWLDTHISPSGNNTIIYDTGLNTPHAAAESKATGDTLKTIVKVSNTQPVSEFNRVWIKNNETEVEIPTKAELDDVIEQIGDLTELETTEKSNLVGAINEVLGDVPQVDNTLSVTGAAADAKKTGDELSELNERFDSLVEPSSVNLFDGDYDESGYIDDGVDKSSSSFKRTSKYYPIIGESTGNLYAFLSETTDVFSILFFDASKAWISNATVNNLTTKTITLPSNARYFRSYTRAAYTGNVTLALVPVSSYIPYDDSVKLKDGIVTYESLNSELSDLLQENPGINIFDNNYDASGYIDDGVDKRSSSYVRTTSFYPVDATKGNLYVYHQNSGTASLLFFDASQEWIKNVNIGASGTLTVAIPSNARYYRSYKNIALTDGITIAYTPVSSYIPYETHLDIKDDSITYDMLTDDVKARIGGSLTGKTIAFMGDSIIGNFYDATGVCAVLAEKTGATVINCAFGGTRLAYSVGESIQYTYMNAISGAGLSNAIASGTWTDQDAAIAGLTGVPAYFPDRLATLKAIDWSEVDFIMWEYGTNDFMNRVMLSDESDPTNLYAFDNAYRHAIKTILTAYPNIRIITATPIYRWWQSAGVFTDDSNTHTETDYDGGTSKLIDFVAMAQDISKEYQIPCIDDYYTIGANRYTRLAYFDSTDGTHPNANGRKRIAEHLAAQLMSLV